MENVIPCSLFLKYVIMLFVHIKVFNASNKPANFNKFYQSSPRMNILKFFVLYSVCKMK